MLENIELQICFVPLWLKKREKIEIEKSGKKRKERKKKKKDIEVIR